MFMSVPATNVSKINEKRPGKIGINIISSQMISNLNEFVPTPQPLKSQRIYIDLKIDLGRLKYNFRNNFDYWHPCNYYDDLSDKKTLYSYNRITV